MNPDTRGLLVLLGVVLVVVLGPIAVGAQHTPIAAQQVGPGGNSTTGTDVVVRQGESCYPVSAFGNGTQNISAFYDYRSPYTEPSGWYHAYGPAEELLRPDTSQVYLYNGSDGLSLVFVNDGGANGSVNGSGGTVAVDITGLPESGNWTVQDDAYPGQDDVFEVGDGSAHIEWYWNNGNRSDGAAFVGLGGSDWEEITIDPAFNEESPGYPYYRWDGPPESNEITSWVVRSANGSADVNGSADANATTGADANESGTNGSDEATVSESDESESDESAADRTVPAGTTYELDMNESITVARGPCDAEPPTAALTAGPENLTPGAEVTLDANGSTDNDAISRYRWDTDGDGTVEVVTNESTLTTTYNESGSYDPRVTVVDRANNTANASVTLQVEAETTTTTATSTTTATTRSTTGATATGSPDGEGTTTDASAPTTDEAASDGGSGANDAVERASAAAERAADELAGMDSASLIGLAVLGGALLIIGVVVLRR